MLHGETKVVEHIEKIRMASVPQRPPHHNRHNRVFHIEGPPGTLMTTPLDTPVDVQGSGFASEPQNCVMGGSKWPSTKDGPLPRFVRN